MTTAAVSLVVNYINFTYFIYYYFRWLPYFHLLCRINTVNFGLMYLIFIFFVFFNDEMVPGRSKKKTPFIQRVAKLRYKRHNCNFDDEMSSSFRKKGFNEHNIKYEYIDKGVVFIPFFCESNCMMYLDTKRFQIYTYCLFL